MHSYLSSAISVVEEDLMGAARLAATVLWSIGCMMRPVRTRMGHCPLTSHDSHDTAFLLPSYLRDERPCPPRAS